MQTKGDDLRVTKCKFKKLGTEVDLQILLSSDKEVQEAQRDLIAAKKELDYLEKIFSRFCETSEIVKLNSRLGEFLEASDELREVSDFCIKYYEKTSGYFDPRIIENLEIAGYDKDFSQIDFSKSDKLFSKLNKNIRKDLFVKDKKIKINCRMDFTGIAKGWFVDRIANFLKNKGYRDFVVDIGGDMFFSGRGPNGKEWCIDIEGIDPQKLLIALSGNAIATSGIGKRKWEKNGKRFHHLINPLKPSEFSFDLKSVTVISETTVDADVCAKSIFLMGKRKGLEFAKENEIACAILDYRGNAFISPEIKKYIFS